MLRPFCFRGNPNNNVLATLLISKLGSQQQIAVLAITIQEFRRFCDTSHYIWLDCLFCSHVMLTSIITKEFSVVFKIHTTKWTIIKQTFITTFQPENRSFIKLGKSASQVLIKALSLGRNITTKVCLMLSTYSMHFENNTELALGTTGDSSTTTSQCSCNWRTTRVFCITIARATGPLFRTQVLWQ